MSREDIATAWLWIAQWWDILSQFAREVSRDLRKDFWFLVYQLRWSRPKKLAAKRKQPK